MVLYKAHVKFYTDGTSWMNDKESRKKRLFLVCTMSFWTERNKICFDGTPTLIPALKARCLITLFGWIKRPDLFDGLPNLPRTPTHKSLSQLLKKNKSLSQ